MAAPKTMLSIGEVSAQTGLTTHTLRFYEQEGLFVEPVGRHQVEGQPVRGTSGRRLSRLVVA